MTTKEPEHSWINFKIDKKMHTKFAMILKLENLPIRTAMTRLVQEYVDNKKELLRETLNS